jgi:hypothetical protein
VALLVAQDEAKRARRRARYEASKHERRPATTGYERLHAPARPPYEPDLSGYELRIAELEARLARTKGAVAYAEIERELAALRQATAVD